MLGVQGCLRVSGGEALGSARVKQAAALAFFPLHLLVAMPLLLLQEVAMPSMGGRGTYFVAELGVSSYRLQTPLSLTPLVLLQDTM